MRLDHLAICAADLAEGVAWAEARFGVPMGAGGKHARYGTHNRLLGLANGLYLEVIAPDPDAPIDGPRWFGLDTFSGPPRLANWICRVPNLAAALQDFPECGPAEALERDGLRWDIGVPPGGSLPMGGALPTLIEWHVAHPPGESLPPSGVTFLSLDILHPQADALAARLSVPGVRFAVDSCFSLSARFATPTGEIVL